MASERDDWQYRGQIEVLLYRMLMAYDTNRSAGIECRALAATTQLDPEQRRYARRVFLLGP